VHIENELVRKLCLACDKLEPSHPVFIKSGSETVGHLSSYDSNMSA
jgi:hypothetical protein